MRIFRRFLFFMVLISALGSQAQGHPSEWASIDYAVSRSQNLDSVMEVLAHIKENASRSQDYFDVLHAQYNVLRIADRRTEDSLYFFNAAILDSIVRGNSAIELRAGAELLLAKRIAGFSRRSLEFNRERYRRRDIPVDYAAFTRAELDSISDMHFRRAAELASGISNGVESFIWLAGDPLVFLIKPTFYDVVMLERINSVQPAFYGYGIKQSLVQMDKSKFEAFVDSVYRADSNKEYGLKYFGEWMDHWRNNLSTKSFIETLARKYVAGDELNYDQQLRRVYRQYLEHEIYSPFIETRAHAVYQLALSLRRSAAGYNDEEFSGSSIDTSVRGDATRALTLIRNNTALLDSFDYLKQILKRVEATMLKPFVAMRIQNENLPGEPILAELKFKNTPTLYYSVRRRDANEIGTTKTNKTLRHTISNYPELLYKEVDLPDMVDNNIHNVLLKLDPLPLGNYCLVFSADKNIDDSANLHFVNFKVTSIAIVNSDERVFILDRKTGRPIPRAKVSTWFVSSDTSKREVKPVRQSISKDGSFEFKDQNRIRVMVGTDSIEQMLQQGQYYREYERYDKDVYDDRAEYYEEQAQAYLFTDRSIYRPGQTVNFKMIVFTRNVVTGERILLTAKNLNTTFTKVFKRLMRELRPKLFLRDAFNKDIDSLAIKLNEYGSFSGSFKIPKSASTGEWSLETDEFEMDYNTGQIRVEEYKRPTYEVFIDKTKKELLPGDTFSFKVRLKAYSGAVLNNVPVRYTLKRTGHMPGDEFTKLVATILFADTLGYTNEQGEMDIPVTDLALKNFKGDSAEIWNFDYHLEVNVVDQTGESYEANASTNISSRPVNIRFRSKKRFDRYDPNEINVSVYYQNAGKVEKHVNLSIYREVGESMPGIYRATIQTDTSLYSMAQLREWFPFYNFEANNLNEAHYQKVIETRLDSAQNGKLSLDPALFSPGKYLLYASVLQNGYLLGDNRTNPTRFEVFDSRSKIPPANDISNAWLINPDVQPGDTIRLASGNSMASVYTIYHISYVSRDKNGKKERHDIYESRDLEKGVNIFRWKIPSSAIEQVLITQFFIWNNSIFKDEETIRLWSQPGDAPEIVVEKYRKLLSPGATENFTLSIKTRNVNTIAELMTTMYDASLDKLEDHEWNIPRLTTQMTLEHRWPYDITSSSTSSYLNASVAPWISAFPVKTPPLWWFKEDVMGDWNHIVNATLPGSFRSFMETDMNSVGLMGKIPGILVQSANNGVFADTRITLRGIRSLSGNKDLMIVLDGVPYKGSLAAINPDLLKDVVILQGAQGAALYGAEGSNGVIVLSTKGVIVIPELPVPQLPPRKNFNELAFFFPSIHIDKDGLYSFEFTMPESLTEWKWKMLAHTKRAQFVYKELTLHSNLPLMVQPNVPRLLYQGDRILLKTRISNLDTIAVNGEVSYRIEDVVTGEDVTKLFLAETRKPFNAGPKLNTYAGFEISVPDTFTHPIKLITGARTKSIGDAEEHIIPILSRKIFVRQEIPFQLAGRDTVVKTPTLPGRSDMFGNGIFIQPKPQAALLNSLAYLSEYSYNCAEQTFNKLLARLTALTIIRKDSSVQDVFRMTKNVINHDSADQSLPDELSEAQMPWLKLDKQHAKEQRSMLNLLDSSIAKEKIGEYITRLNELQNADGGLSWFDGGRSDLFITNYVLAGFGRMSKDGWLTASIRNFSIIQSMITRMKQYTREQLANRAKENNAGSDLLFGIYAQSFWYEKEMPGDTMNGVFLKMLESEWSRVDQMSLSNQSMLVIATIRLFPGNEVYRQRALRKIESIAQLAIRDDNGIRWKEISDGDDLNAVDEEGLQKIVEAFDVAGIHPEIREGVSNWLLNTRADHEWRSTRGTAATIAALWKDNRLNAGTSQTLTITGSTGTGWVTNSLASGNNFQFMRSNRRDDIAIHKNEMEPVRGSISWYYFAEMSEAGSINSPVKINKQLMVFDPSKSTWTNISNNATLHVGDLVKVVLSIESSRMLQYVMIDDKRGAAFEPKDVHSGYVYGKDFGYYGSIRDQGMQFFAERIPSGKTSIEYEIKVAQEGTFTNGIATLQCMYRPDITAYSQAMIVQAVK